MAVRQILYMGDPRLREIAQRITTFDTPELHALVQDLMDTMQAEDGAGLAAPQIGVGLRILVFGFDTNPRYPDAEPVPQTVLVNPVIEIMSDDIDEGWEGCLSVPGLRGVVPRFTHIRYSGFDHQGFAIEREAHGFHARVVQHEYDHLDGTLYPQRMTDMRLFGFTETLVASGQLVSMPCDTQTE
ncbi:MAG: peptide deformylase [Gammaproteobacteria bacterium]|nr:peptide deformylase [Gammaproteobacteria bacterium]